MSTGGHDLKLHNRYAMEKQSADMKNVRSEKGPRIMVMADMEGASGICRSSQVSPDGEHYAEGRRYLTMDVNACVDGCLEGGASQVIVRDSHSCGFNLIWSELNSGASYIQGCSVSKERIPAAASFDGLILLAYHAMAGTPEAILEHTINSRGWQNFWMNGVLCGELAIDAGIAGDHGLPVILVTGDDKVCREAREMLPEVVTVEVKKGIEREGGLLLPMEQALLRIREGAAKAVRGYKHMKPFKVSSPVCMRLELVSRGKIPATRLGVTVLDGRTYEVSGKTVEEALNNLLK